MGNAAAIATEKLCLNLWVSWLQISCQRSRLASHESARLCSAEWRQPRADTSNEYSHLSPVSHSSKPGSRNIWLGWGWTECWQCSLWMCFRLINGHVKQHGGHFSHPPHPSSMSKTTLVCSAGLHISARALNCGGHRDKAWEIISESNSWFHLQLFANVFITNFKIFPAWLYEFSRSPWSHRSWNSTNRATRKKFASLQRVSRFAWKKLEMWDSPFAPAHPHNEHFYSKAHSPKSQLSLAH